MILLAIVLGLVAGARLHACWPRGVDRRLGRLPSAPVSTAEALRASRLRELGEVGTMRVWNCGTILHVDYENGVLVVERRSRAR